MQNTQNTNYIQNEIFAGVVSKQECLDLILQYTIDYKTTVLISIRNPGDETIEDNLIEEFKDTLFIDFWDIEESSGDYKIITKEQGKTINDFINKNKDSKFLVHCEAGQSRSAGVGLAVECIVNYNGNVYSYRTGHSDIKEYKRYSPNLTVFDTIMERI